MKGSTSKEKILKKIRNALIYDSEAPYPDIDTDQPVFKKGEDSLDVTFAKEFNKIAGQFIYCEDENDLINNLQFLVKARGWDAIYCADEILQEMLSKASIPFVHEEEKFEELNIGFTKCECLVARLGSIIVSSKQASGRRLYAYPEVHIVFAETSQLVEDLDDALKFIQEKYVERMPSMITTITGPSRTADIEKTLVMGAHGPKELYLFLSENIST